jgi:hypothetical protein
MTGSNEIIEHIESCYDCQELNEEKDYEKILECYDNSLDSQEEEYIESMR